MRFKLPEVPPAKLITALRNYDLLPAIVFQPTRRRCDEAASEVAIDRGQRMNAEKEQLRQELFDEFAVKHPEIRTHKHRKMVIRAGVAAHHAGHIPGWKLLVEKMMSAGLLEAIFATSTVAAGVDFPARTVVISNSEMRGNDGWRSISASELQQMTGRAGRRGKDKVGFVILAPSAFQNPPKIAELLKSQPDPLNSQFRATYTSLLNLLDAFKSFEQVREIAERSFAFRETSRQIAKLETQIEKFEETLAKRLRGNEFGFSFNDAVGFERLVSARLRLEERQPVFRAEVRMDWLRDSVVPGRIVTRSKSGKRFFIVMRAFGDKVTVMRDDGLGTSLALAQIGRVYENLYDLGEFGLDHAIEDIHAGRNPALQEPRLSSNQTNNEDAVEILSNLIDSFIPEGISEDARRNAYQILWESCSDASAIDAARRDIEILRQEIWIPFERRARVLDHFGYLEIATETVTDAGKWLADLRVDRPLLVGEALRQGIFDDLEPRHAASLMASLAADPDRNFGELMLSDEMEEIIGEFDKTIHRVSGIEIKMRVEPAFEINYTAAAAVEAWADGLPWNELVFQTRAEEGDLVRLISRTGEALMQLAHLKNSNSKVADLARQTAEIVLRAPIR